jgi:hypothetical protein
VVGLGSGRAARGTVGVCAMSLPSSSPGPTRPIAAGASVPA